MCSMMAATQARATSDRCGDVRSAALEAAIACEVQIARMNELRAIDEKKIRLLSIHRDDAFELAATPSIFSTTNVVIAAGLFALGVVIGAVAR